MAEPQDKFYITTAIDYANGDPHFGHALEKIGADAIARFHRQLGRSVHFLIGMDEHGTAELSVEARYRICADLFECVPKVRIAALA